jgi:hypothetical protein
MNTEDPAITFERVAGENAMNRQLLSLLLGSSPVAMEALRSIAPETTRELMQARPVSDAFIEQAIDALVDITKRAEAVAAARQGR